MGAGNQKCLQCRAEFPLAATPRSVCPLCGKPLAGARAGNSQYYYARGGRAFGPVSSSQLRDLAAAGQLLPTDLVQRIGSNKWAPASKVKNLFDAVPSTSAPAAKDRAPAPAVAEQKPAVPRPVQPAAPAPAESCSPPPAKLEPVAAGCPAGLTIESVSRRRVLSEAVVVPDALRCVQCGCCSFNCPIGIDVRAHAWRGIAIEDSHCLTCSECVRRCPRGVLSFETLPVFKH